MTTGIQRDDKRTTKGGAREEEISFFVAGMPVPQGSTRAFLVKGRPIVTSTCKNLKAWRERVAAEAQRASVAIGGFYREGDFAYIVRTCFVFSPPKSHAKSYYYYHNKRPDIDKLVRALLDGITGILIEDDAQVKELEVRKEYTNPHVPYDPPGVYATVTRVDGRVKK